MSIVIADFETIEKLLGRSQHEPEVRKFFGMVISTITREEFYGSLEFKAEGIDVVFQEAPWVIPRRKSVIPKSYICLLSICTGMAMKDTTQYRGPLPYGLAFGDSEDDVLHKLGNPIRIGGGNVSHLLKRVVPRWFWYSLDPHILHVQFDTKGSVEMITPQVLDLLENKGGLRRPSEVCLENEKRISWVCCPGGDGGCSAWRCS